MNDFINKYGTHVVLGCTYGYRKIERLRTRIKAKKDFQKFQNELTASFNGIGKVKTNFENEKKREKSSVYHADGIYQAGGRYLLKPILSDDYLPSQNDKETSSPDVVSYDETMSIADMLTHSKNDEGTIEWDLFSKFYRFWTDVRIRDLSQGECQFRKLQIYLHTTHLFFTLQGWSETPFACSYKLTFRRKNILRSNSRYSIFVHVIGEQYNTSICQHQCKEKGWKLERHSQITPVISSNVKTIMLTTTSEDIHLSQIGHTFDIFFRSIPCEFDKEMGKIVHYQINLRGIDTWKLKLNFNLEEYIDGTVTIMKRKPVKYDRSIAWARSIICQ